MERVKDELHVKRRVGEKEKPMEKKEIPVFYSFRFICSLMVVLFHVGLSDVGGYFVSFFIVLSVFL